MCKHRTNGNRAVQDLSPTKEDGYEILGRLHLLLGKHTHRRHIRCKRLEIASLAVLDPRDGHGDKRRRHHEQAKRVRQPLERREGHFWNTAAQPAL